MKTEALIVERTFDTPIAKVWSALINNEEIKNWYFKLEDFKAEVGFEFDFIGGPEDGVQYLHLCGVTEVIDGKKIAYTWRYGNYPGNSLLTWELFDKGGQTLVRLTHSGLETFEEVGPDFSRDSFHRGWNYFMHTALKGYLEAE